MEGRYLSKEKLDDFYQAQADMMANVKKMQADEKELYNKLEANVATSGSLAERDQLTAQIKTLADARLDAYKDLVENYSILRNNVAQSRGDLVDQMALIDISQQQLDGLRKQIGDINEVKNNKERMLEINTYYGKKFQAQKELMQLIIVVCVPLLLLAFLAKLGKLGSTLASSIGAVILAIGLYFIFIKLIDISSRSKTKFDEYEWNFDPASIKPTVIEYDLEQLGWGKKDMSGIMGSCIGESCCGDNLKYNSKLNKCEV